MHRPELPEGAPMGVRRDYSALPPALQEAAEQNIPLSVHWDLTWRCDHSCVHCYLTERRQPELTYDEAVGVLDQLAEAGTLVLLFSGGDPFLRPDAIDIMRAARERGFDLRINTHGNAIDEAMADALAELCPTKISLSVYAEQPEIHDAVTLIPGSHAKTIAAARRMVARDVMVVFKTPVMVHNRDHYHRVADLAREVGAEWELDANIMNDDQSDFGLCGIGAHGTDRILALLQEMEFSGREPVPLEALRVASSNEPTCGAGSVSGYISPDGRLFPCLLWRDPLGSLREHDFAELWWESETAARQRELKRGSYLQDCDGCGFHGQCSYCPGISHAETGDPARRSEWVCERTHLSMSAIELHERVGVSGEPLPDPGTPEAAALLTEGLPTFAERQWAARHAGMATQSDRLPVGLVLIGEPRKQSA